MKMKKPEDMSLEELKVLYYDTAKNLEIIQGNMNVIIGLIDKKENVEPKKEEKDKN